MTVIEKIYCISLKTEIQRRNLMKQQLSSLFENKYIFIDAYNHEHQKVIDTFNNLTIPTTNLTAMSQIAICYSHLEAIKLIYKNKLDFGAIIEDDIRLSNDFHDKLNKYINKNPEIVDIMKSEPCILHLAGGSGFTEKYFGFKTYPHVVNICFNIINWRTAKILIDNFYPITCQFDTYVHNMVGKYNIKEYVATPILAWDISSTMFKDYWYEEDTQYHNKFKTLSKIAKLDFNKVTPNFIRHNNGLYSILFNKMLDANRIKYNTRTNRTTIHYTNADTPLTTLNENSIIVGHGITSLNEDVNINQDLILFVRGPLTAKILKKQKYECPIQYADPLILFNKNILGIDSKSNEYPDIYYFTRSEPEFNSSKLRNAKTIVTSYYEGILMGNVFGKYIIWISEDYIDDIKIKDYLMSYKSISQNIEPLYLDYVVENINNRNKIDFPQINKKEFEAKIQFLLNFPWIRNLY